jgi:hypothetical protein
MALNPPVGGLDMSPPTSGRHGRRLCTLSARRLDQRRQYTLASTHADRRRLALSAPSAGQQRATGSEDGIQQPHHG